MAWIAPVTAIPGQTADPAFWNQEVGANENALRAGGLSVAGQVAGDLLAASSATQLVRVPAVNNGVPYFTGGQWTVKSVVDILYPVGSIIELVVSTNPGTLLGGGVWGGLTPGLMMVGVNAHDPDFASPNVGGGVRTHDLSVAEMPAHSHTVTDGGHTHEQGYDNGGSAEDPEFSTDRVQAYPGTTNRVTSSSTTGITVANAGSRTFHNNLMPYIVVYRWYRFS